MSNDATTYRPVSTQSITTSGTTAATATAFNGQTYIVRIHATKACFITFAGTPTATTSHMYMGDGMTEYFSVSPGEKVAALQATEAGTVYVTEMTS